MNERTDARVSRRGLLAVGGAVGLGGLIAACGGGGGSANRTGASNAAGGWTFTDDRGTTITEKSRPKRVVAYVGSAAALRDFGVDEQIVGVFGPTTQQNGRPDPLSGNLDVRSLPSLGQTWGKFNIEKYAALNPQLLVTSMWQPNVLWYVPDASKNKILALAPSVGITIANVRLPQPIQRHEQLARALGADLTASSVASAKARYDQAIAALRTAAKRGIRVLAASASANLLYVSDPRVYADLSYFRDLGVNLVQPDKVTGGFFDNLSWERADKYPADLIMLDSRTIAVQPKDLASKPTWSRLPAVRAGQVTPWLSEPRFSYAGCAPHIETFATAMQRARKVT